jgi:hypothetical protein
MIAIVPTSASQNTLHHSSLGVGVFVITASEATFALLVQNFRKAFRDAASIIGIH